MNIVYPPFESELWYALRPEEAAGYQMMAFDFVCRKGCFPTNTYDLTGEMGYEFGHRPYPDIVFVAAGGTTSTRLPSLPMSAIMKQVKTKT
jgi:hypothetical protein